MMIIIIIILIIIIIIINNQVLRKAKIAVEISSPKGCKYEVNMMSLTILESTQSTLIN